MIADSSFLSVPQAASLLGISRVAVFKRIKNGQLPAKKIGRNYLIKKQDLPDVFSTSISDSRKKELDRGMMRVIKEYGETLRLLGSS